MKQKQQKQTAQQKQQQQNDHNTHGKKLKNQTTKQYLNNKHTIAITNSTANNNTKQQKQNKTATQKYTHIKNKHNKT